MKRKFSIILKRSSQLQFVFLSFRIEFVADKSKMKGLVLLMFLPTVFSFDTESFIRKYCKWTERSDLTCSRFNLTRKDVQGIQDQDFVISTNRTILFREANIGVLNVNFFNKFPNAVEMYFVDAVVRLTQSYKKTRYEDPLLKKLSFSGCTIKNNKDTNALKYLYNLKELLIIDSTFESNVLDTKFLEEKTNLILLELSMGNYNFHPRGFYLLRNISFLSMRKFQMESLPEYMFKDNQKIIYLDLSGNLLRRIPVEAIFPNSLQYLYLNDNEISDIQQSDFQNIGSLKHSYLDGNQISFLGENIFRRVQGLEYLSLARNKIRRISLEYFQYLKNLKLLELQENFIEDCTDLERLPSNETRFYPQNEWFGESDESYGYF